jgi:ParB-like chromosome segregation protein Spo0J
MTSTIVFRLVPLDTLLEHEEIDLEGVDALAERIRRDGVVVDPIWVAAGSNVILNGHHRVAALRRLGARRAPAWVVDFHSDLVRLERWNDGPPIPKAEVIERARSGRLFTPKTTRHVLATELPARPTPLAELLDGPPLAAARPAGQRRASGRSRRPDGRAPDADGS